jgi:DNA-binding transcriptional LysR family regulator
MELDLSQGAVSRQVQKLEGQLGVELFVRQKKRLVLTPAGQAYAQDIRVGISSIANATVKLATNPQGGTLELAVLPGLGTHWLAPRLPGFLAAHPGVTLNLSTRLRPFDFAVERVHGALTFGQVDWPGTQSLQLMEEELVPVFAPQFEVYAPGDLAQLPLLALETRRRAWSLFFEAQGVAPRMAPVMSFDQFATMTQAAIAGLGAALLPRYMAEGELASGRLATLKAVRPAIVGSYFLVWPVEAERYPPLTGFREWITDEAVP